VARGSNMPLGSAWIGPRTRTHAHPEPPDRTAERNVRLWLPGWPRREARKRLSQVVP